MCNAFEGLSPFNPLSFDVNVKMVEKQTADGQS